MSDKREFTQSSGDVFTDRSLDNPDELLSKANIMAEIAYLLEENGWTQTKAAERLGVPQREISKIMRDKLSRFSLQRLLEPLTTSNRNVKIVIEPTHERGQVSVEGLSQKGTAIGNT